MRRPVTDGRHLSSTLGDNCVLDLAVDRTKLMGQHLLGLIDHADDTVLHVLNGQTGLVAALGHDVGVVGRATTVPRKKLVISQNPQP